MKRQVLVLLAGCACGIASATAGVSSSPPRLKELPLAALASTAQRAEAADAAPMRTRAGGVNRQVQRASTRSKMAADAGPGGTDTYIVRLRDLPVATYDGRIPGYAATARQGRREATKATGWLERGRAAFGIESDEKRHAKAYRNFLHQRQGQALAQLRSRGLPAQPRAQFTQAINGFTVRADERQARQIAALPQVAYVQRSRLYKLTTDQGPLHIGAGAAWSGDTVAGVPLQGEGVVVGMIDTGINTDHPSFAATGDDGYAVQNPRGAGNYLGDCAGAWPSLCNDKLIGVWSWPVITGIYDNDEFQAPDWQFWEPRVMRRPANGEDYNGHGSHTASTAAGNVVVNVPFLGPSLGDGDGVPTGFSFERVSGVAPHANLVAYQVCYPGGGPDDPYYGCSGEAILQAIEQAIDDEVDVINFSIGGDEGFPWDDSVELAFLSARESGISVAVSAGNAGEDAFGNEVPSSADHSSPWLLAVAAATHGRTLDISPKRLELSGGDTEPPYLADGKGISGAGAGFIVNAADYGDELCLQPFAAGTFTPDQLVVCKRGQNARVTKAANVQAGGAGGFILYNAGWDIDGIVDDVYPLPGVHLHYSDGLALLGWLASGSGHQGSISSTTIGRTVDEAKADQLAAFSSRGPSSTYEGHLIPGITAPGVDVFAAYADEHPFSTSPQSQDWSLLSGTSMASPHVAGAMALVRQAHPDWTPAQVQSALQMTAVESVTYAPYPGADPQPAGVYRAGSGRVDVHAAIDSGLVMDETAANFEIANPRNGGDASRLNLPELVNLHCHGHCSWIRTVQATRDGTWQASGTTGEYSVRLEAQPAQFTLRAGQRKSIIITAEVLDSQTRTGNSEQEVWGGISLTADGLPAAHWPVALKFDHGSLPENLPVLAHRDAGTYHLDGLTLPAMSDAQYRAYGLTRATVEDITLPEDPDWASPIQDGDFSSTRTLLVDVPAGAVRLIAENLKDVKTTAEEAWRRGDADIYIGFDANGNGVADLADEAICYSTSATELDYCNVNHPEPGQYWIVVHDFNTNFNDTANYPVSDTYRIATAVVMDTPSADLAVSGPQSTDGVTPGAVDLRWTLDGFGRDDVAYGAFDIGPSGAPGSVGFVPVKLTRGIDDVSLTLSQTRARPGDVVDVSLHVLENDSGLDRDYALQSTLPAGLTLVPGSVKVSTSQEAGLAVTGSTLRVAGQQLNSEHWQRDYAVTTNRTDPLCRTAQYGTYLDGGNANGGYVDLARFGFLPDAGGHAGSSGVFQLPLRAYWDGHGASLYNNNAFFEYGTAFVSPQGWMTLDDLNLFDMAQHMPLPNYLPPDVKLAPMWMGSFFTGKALGTPLNIAPWWDPTQHTSGMTSAFTSDEVIVEWDGARSETSTYDFDTGEITWSEFADRYDFELILDRRYRFEAGEYEAIMAYDHLDFADQPGDGSIGLQGFHGPRGSFQPVEDYRGVGFAFDDLKDKLSDGLVVCYDYVGPESTQFDLRFQVRVSEGTAGQTLPVAFDSQVTGLPARSVDGTIVVAGNLQLGVIDDQATDEDTPLEGLEVAYADADAGPNTITVSGDHVQATVHSHEPGARFDLVPDADFSGVTEVTVTVADRAHPDDRASTTFKLEVAPANDAPVARVVSGTQAITGATVTLDASPSSDADGDTLAYEWTQVAGAPATVVSPTAATTQVSGLAPGDYRFEVRVSDGTADSVATVDVAVSATAPSATVTTHAGGHGGGGLPPATIVSLLVLALARRRRAGGSSKP